MMKKTTLQTGAEEVSLVLLELLEGSSLPKSLLTSFAMFLDDGGVGDDGGNAMGGGGHQEFRLNHGCGGSRLKLR